MKPGLLLLGGGLVLGGLLLLAPAPGRAGAWRTLSRAGEAIGWWGWRTSLAAHDRYAEIMMDEAQRGAPSE